MNRIAKLYGFEDVEKFTQYLITKAREERLNILVELNEDRCAITIEPQENRVYFCPYHGETREK